MSAASFVYTNCGQDTLTDWTKLYVQIRDIRGSIHCASGKVLEDLLLKQVYLCRIIANIEDKALVPTEYRT